MTKKDLRVVLISRKLALTVSVMMIISGIVLAAVGGMEAFKTTEAVALQMEGKVILIDPGHGGIDAGASSGDILEKTINLDVANYLKGYIEQGGGVVYMTRLEDVNTADPNRPKGETQKMSDLKARKKNIEDYKADIFVSIHMNKFQQSQYRGLQVFYDPHSEESKKLGESLQKAVQDVVKDGNTRKPKATGDSIYVLKGNSVPSVLIECGFLSNPEEAKLLNTPEYQKKLAWGIYIGIIRYLK